MHKPEVFLTTWSTDRPQLEHVRREVFILEQSVPEDLEWDDEDPVCVHVLAILNREPVGTGRLTPAGKIGRVAVARRCRGTGLGRQIMKLLTDAARHRGMTEVRLSAQLSAMPFYEKLGFRAEGEVFEEAGIPHRNMRMSLG
ncbi:MAG: GNAT family N-acetyltransferase [Steroidobacteraceae bacterium]|jgi:predicted GNAT family N-acyltransferase|nr:GNAT family N-acetyltransferase [Steroidobacteraceae bacterium]